MSAHFWNAALTQVLNFYLYQIQFGLPFEINLFLHPPSPSSTSLYPSSPSCQAPFTNSTHWWFSNYSERPKSGNWNQFTGSLMVFPRSKQKILENTACSKGEYCSVQLLNEHYIQTICNTIYVQVPYYIYPVNVHTQTQMYKVHVWLRIQWTPSEDHKSGNTNTKPTHRPLPWPLTHQSPYFRPRAAWSQSEEGCA